jgi:hypothetical protein
MLFSDRISRCHARRGHPSSAAHYPFWACGDLWVLVAAISGLIDFLAAGGPASLAIALLLVTEWLGGELASGTASVS